MSGQNFNVVGGSPQAIGSFTNSTLIQNIGVQDGQSRHRCLEYFAVTDPRDVKTNIHDTRGDALKQSYEWILHHPQFQSWRDSSDSQVLWLKGDPGKGKTMLLCGIIDELGPTTKLKDYESTTLLSFFFCQATVPKLSSATAVLRGLIYMLVDQEPSFLSLIQKKFKEDGKPHFGDGEEWAALKSILLEILNDDSLGKIYLVVDALDECIQDQDNLLRFILQDTKGLAHVKWIISSRNHITQRTILADSQAILSLELRENAESVSGAIGAYISSRIAELESLQGDKFLLEYVQQALEKKAEGTFLWVALVVQELQQVDSWDVKQVVDDVPTGLDDIYARMMKQIALEKPRTRDFCHLVLSAAALAYRPLQLLELGVVSGLPDEVAGKTKDLETIISRSGSFLTVRDGTIYFVHQSAKDFLDTTARLTLFPSGSAAAHRRMFIRSLPEMSKTLRRDMYGLGALGTDINQVQPPSLDPLVVVRYSCIYWVDHLRESGSCEDMQDGGAVDTFLRTRYLYWLEALSLMRIMTDGIMSIQRLRDLLLERAAASPLSILVEDAYRFVLYHLNAIEKHPLQVYGSGLVFSPSRSMIKELFWHERPKDTIMVPLMGEDWDGHTGSCLQTLEGHENSVNSVVFSPNISRVVSGSSDNTIKIWDARTGAYLQTLEGHSDWVRSAVFSNDSSRIASGSDDKTIKIWDARTGACLQTLKGHDKSVTSVVFSPDSSRVASGSGDKTIKIWDAHTGTCLQTLEGHDDWVNSVVFSHDSSRVASGSGDKTIKIWDAHTGAYLRTLEGHGKPVISVVLSPDSSRVASGSGDKTIKIWDAHTGACVQTLDGHSKWVNSVVFSPDSSRIVSGSSDNTIKIWNVHTGACVQTLQGHSDWVRSVAFSSDSSRVASGSDDKTIKIWDARTGAYLQMLEGHSDWVRSVVFSSDSGRVASGSDDKTIKIWDARTGAYLQTLEGHSDWVRSVVFSPDSSRVASGSDDKTINIWDARIGTCLQTLEGHGKPVISVVFSVDGSRVASGSDDDTIKIWDAHTGACLQTLEGHDDSVRSVVFSVDGSRVASGSGDKTIKIWDAQTGFCLQTLGISSAVRNIFFDATGSSLHTDLGIIPLRDSPTPAPTAPLETLSLDLQLAPATHQPQRHEYRGYGISSNRYWITRRSRNWLWLLPTYRPKCLAVGQSGLALVLGCQSGRVLIFRFAADDGN